MKRVLKHIEQRQAQHDALPFFARLERPGSLAVLTGIYPSLCFWVFTFQDVLALNLEKASTSKSILERHLAEDSGHQRWYLDDLRRLGCEPTIEWLFGETHATTRHHSQRLLAGVLGSRFDTARVAAVIAMEAAGNCIFRRFPAYVASIPGAPALAYFSDHHFAVEEAHDLHNDALRGWLSETEVSSEERNDAIRVVDAVFDGIDGMIEGYESTAIAIERGSAEL